MKKSIAFLLGAGCEGKGQLGLPSGNTFKRDTIIAKDVKELIYALNKKTVPEIKNGPIITHNSTNILYQTILEYGLDNFSFSDKDRNKIEAYLKLNSEKSTLKKEQKDKIRNRFSKIYYDKFYNAIKNVDTNTDKLDYNVKFFLDHACFYSFVDSLFNYLRKPEKYHVEVNRIIKLYYSAYLSIILKLLDETELSSYKQIIETGTSVSENRRALGELVRSAQKRICVEKQNINGLYYNIIRKYICNHNDSEVGIITTNYTEFAQTLTGTDKNQIAFVHGKLDLFESTKSKRTTEIEHFSEDECIFPFIFVQSGVKPIVNAFQIHEFEKAARMIENANELMVLGYGVNSDDEHISNMLRERVRNSKAITCFLYENTPEEQSHIEHELQCEGIIRFEDAANFEKMLKSL